MSLIMTWHIQEQNQLPSYLSEFIFKDIFKHACANVRSWLSAERSRRSPLQIHVKIIMKQCWQTVRSTVEAGVAICTCATNSQNKFPDSWSQIPSRSHRNATEMSLVSRTFALFGKTAGFTQSSMKLVGSEWKEEESCGKQDKGSLGSCFSHIHTRLSTSEATADKNAKEEDETRIISRSCLWIAVCILRIW